MKFLYFSLLLALVIWNFRHTAVVRMLGEFLLRTFEQCSGYRSPAVGEGFYDLPEVEAFAHTLSSYFTAITAIRLYYNDVGWQFAEFEIVLPPSGIADGIRDAIAIEARSYLRQNHGIDNPHIFVPVLHEHNLVIQIASSPKAHHQAQNYNFSPPSRNGGTIEMEVK